MENLYVCKITENELFSVKNAGLISSDFDNLIRQPKKLFSDTIGSFGYKHIAQQRICQNDCKDYHRLIFLKALNT